jgi:glycine/D-amino acid oxidase-like deaminating enzyme
MAEYRRLAWQLAPAVWYHADGNLIWYRDGDAATALAARVERLRAWGYAAEMIPAEVALAELAPGLRGGVADQAGPFAWFPEEAWVDAVALTSHLIDAARHAGCRVLTGPSREVVAIGSDEGSVSLVTLRGGQTIPVTAVVNAAGAAAPDVAALVGRQLPMAPTAGAIIRATMPGGVTPLRRPIESDLLAIRPDGPGRVLLVIDVETAPELATASLGALPLTDPLVTKTLAWGTALLPALATAQPTEALVALRPIPADGFPSIGAVTAIPGYFEAVTHSGVTLAPLIARTLTDEIVAHAIDPLLAPYRPERVALSISTVPLAEPGAGGNHKLSFGPDHSIRSIR